MGKVALGFNSSTVVSDLKEEGPIVFSSVGILGSSALDLVIREDSPSAEAACSGSNDACFSRVLGGAGGISFKTGGTDDYLDHLKLFRAPLGRQRKYARPSCACAW